MKVWFGCTTAEWKNYRQYYFAIRNGLVDKGCVILHDWLDAAEKISQMKQPYERSKKIYQSVIDAISEADLVIIENTIPNFSTAHQITFALQRRKPTLVLRLHKDDTLFADSYIESLGSPDLVVKEYTLENLGQTLNEFIKVNEVGNTQGRYNVVLNKKHKYYLDWASTTHKKSRSEILRDSLDKTIQNDDKYKKYLTH
ncbi:MAG: hypothetical protein JNK26_00790 [Candidatus Doudnabacteria bacterium]|nr:hypothetical protein [Candidatus Doudnabacteria bacterium]